MPPQIPKQNKSLQARTETEYSFDLKFKIGFGILILWFYLFVLGGVNEFRVDLAEAQVLYAAACETGGVIGDVGREALGFYDTCQEAKTKLFWADFFLGPGSGLL